MENISLQSLQIFYIIVLRAEIDTTFGSKMDCLDQKLVYNANCPLGKWRLTPDFGT